MQLLRQHREPVCAAQLAIDLNVSGRTLYRDIAALRVLGASIDGEPGVGYVLRPGFLLPPLMLSEEEIEAVVFGARWAMDKADDKLVLATQRALAKIAAVLPPDLRERLEDVGLLVVPTAGDMADKRKHLALIREVIRAGRKMTITYRDGSDRSSERTVWPFALGFFQETQVLAAWCELRNDFRHFRVDRIIAVWANAERYPRRRKTLVNEWRRKHNIPL